MLLLLLLFAANFEAVCNIFGLSILINANWNAPRENPPPPRLIDIIMQFQQLNKLARLCKLMLVSF